MINTLINFEVMAVKDNYTLSSIYVWYAKFDLNTLDNIIFVFQMYY